MALATTINPGPRSTELDGLTQASESHPIWTELRGPVNIAKLAAQLAAFRLANPAVTDDSVWAKAKVEAAGGKYAAATANTRNNLQLGLKDFDMRVVDVRGSGSSVSYRVQIIKSYDFHSDPFKVDIHGYHAVSIPGADLMRLPGVGLAQNFYVVGTSSVIGP